MRPRAREDGRLLGGSSQVPALAPAEEHQGAGLVVREMPPELPHLQRPGRPGVQGWPCRHP
eukprot:7309046-Alexandrium_andersonii.AAC.1